MLCSVGLEKRQDKMGKIMEQNMNKPVKKSTRIRHIAVNVIVLMGVAFFIRLCFNSVVKTENRKQLDEMHKTGNISDGVCYVYADRLFSKKR